MEDLYNNEYVTKDLGESAALLTSDCAMKSISWKDNVAFFIFEDAEKCKVVSQGYFFENLSVPVRKFYENLKMIKGKLYSSSRLINGKSVPARNRFKGGE